MGKTVPARAVAAKLERAFVRHTVDAKTKARDLLWELDHVARLAQAQLSAAMQAEPKKAQQEMALHRFLRPGPLRWALNWASAKRLELADDPEQRDAGDPTNGVVVLVDEIDKADVAVPNALLEAFGDGSFKPDCHPDTCRGMGPQGDGVRS